MTLEELRDLMVDDSQDVRIDDITGNDVETIYEGRFDELPEDMEDYEISSIDNIYKGTDGYLGINIIRD